MLHNYFLVALRNFRNNRLVSLINVLGLSIGIGACLLISHYIYFELSYDRFHADADQLYRIVWLSDNPQTRTPHPMAQAMADNFPEVESAVSLTPLWKAGLTRRTLAFRNPEKDIRYNEKNVLAVDSTFFDVFGFRLLNGNPRTALTNPRGVILTESSARRYFGEEDPMGRFLQVGEEGSLLEVVGVVEDVPANSHFHFDFLVSYVTLKADDPDDTFFHWSDFGHYNYLKLAEHADAKTLEAKLPDWIIRNRFIDASDEEIELFRTGQLAFSLQPITDIHLRSHLRWELEANSRESYIYLLGTAALFILIIAYVNCINLTTARSLERAKEIGVRKALGALKYQLSLQFVCEALLVSFVSLLLAFFALQWILPYLNRVADYPFTLNDLLSAKSMAVLLLAGTIVGILLGLYPAFYFSTFKPATILRGRFKASAGSGWLRRGLIVFQFGMAVALIVGSLVIFYQLNFLSNKHLGFNQDQVLVVPINNEALPEKVETLTAELASLEDVVSVGATSNLPGQNFNQNSVWSPTDEQQQVDASECYVDEGFFAALDIPFREGRGFSRQYATDSTESLILNQSAVQALNLTDPIGQELVWDQEDRPLRGTIIGVVEDFHYRTLHEPVRPLVFQWAPQGANHILIRVKPTSDVLGAVASIQQIWEQFDQQFGFEFYFLDDSLQAQYQAEQRMSQVFGLFSLITVVIACFGLFGLVRYATAQRTKEVGIRKVLGASTSQVVTLLSRDFTRLVLLALVIAIPVAGWVMRQWLQNFAYQIELKVWIFALAAGIVLLLAGATVIIQTLQTATDNPVKSLRSE